MSTFSQQQHKKIYDRVTRAAGMPIPFRFRGIIINDKLVDAAILALGEAPNKTLPQNCANKNRENTPEGLDRRIKEFLCTDLRTANIISDVLVAAGVVKIVEVINPHSGRNVKGSQLLDEEDWTDVTSISDPQVIAARKSATKVMAGEEFNHQKKNPVTIPSGRQEYLMNKQVMLFIDWLLFRINQPDSFIHGYFLSKKRMHWQCRNLYDAYEKYWWPFKLYCIVQNSYVKGASFSDSFHYLEVIAEHLRKAIEADDPEVTRLACLAVLQWGGVLHRNKEIIMGMGDSIVQYMNSVSQRLKVSTSHIGDNEGIIMNSGFTKIYSLLIDDFMMYDGRVGAALGLLGRKYAEENGLVEIPEEILFSFGDGRLQKGAECNRRDPSSGPYKLPNFNGNSQRQLNDNRKANWLIQQLASQDTPFSDLPQNGVLNERNTAIQSALFMIGYDVALNK